MRHPSGEKLSFRFAKKCGAPSDLWRNGNSFRKNLQDVKGENAWEKLRTPLSPDGLRLGHLI